MTSKPEIDFPVADQVGQALLFIRLAEVSHEVASSCQSHAVAGPVALKSWKLTYSEYQAQEKGWSFRTKSPQPAENKWWVHRIRIHSKTCFNNKERSAGTVKQWKAVIRSANGSQTDHGSVIILNSAMCHFLSREVKSVEPASQPEF